MTRTAERVTQSPFRTVGVKPSDSPSSCRAFARNAVLLCPTHQREGVKSTRKGLREGELEKDNYERLKCVECGESLAKQNPPDEVFSVRTCPDCGREWKELR